MRDDVLMTKIIIDSHETRSAIPALLEQRGVEIEIVEMEVADYVLSNNMAVERKTADDFLGSVIGEEKGKIFRQCRDLVNAYTKPLLLLECDISDLFVQRNIHPQAIWGMLRSVYHLGCPLEFVFTPEGFAKKLIELAEKEQNGKKIFFQPHAGKTKRSSSEEKEYILSSIPEVGGKYAHELLVTFGSIAAIVNAPEDRLAEVVGKSAAKRIREVIR